MLLPIRNFPTICLSNQLYTSKFFFCHWDFFVLPFLFSLELGVYHTIFHLKLFAVLFSDSLTTNKIPRSCKRIEKAVIIFIILYIVKWKYWSLLESILKIWKFPLKSHVIKTIFLPWRNKLFAVRYKIPYEREMKITSPRRASLPSRASSPHVNSPKELIKICSSFTSHRNSNKCCDFSIFFVF